MARNQLDTAMVDGVRLYEPHEDKLLRLSLSLAYGSQISNLILIMKDYSVLARMLMQHY